ncbi:DUF4190 domain-containing protein [Actinocorallia sp. B10E7]|uniref:DUF4190 domain-containing protein n=1 Tax=Actinocorallia sp. B10E7 TaxID=3153558 RepID=UPI00325D7CFF
MSWEPPGGNRPPQPHDPVPSVPHGLATHPDAPRPRGRKKSVTAIAALLFGTFGMVPIAVPLAIAALLRLRRSGKSGSSLAISGLLLSAGWTVIGVVAALLFIGATASHRTSLSGVSFSALKGRAHSSSSHLAGVVQAASSAA